jgi:hypothetical protein
LRKSLNNFVDFHALPSCTMLNPFHLRPYLGHEVRIEAGESIIEGTLTDVDRRTAELMDVSIGWQEFAAMTVELSSILSVASVRCPHPLQLVVGIGLSQRLGQDGVGAFEELRQRLALRVDLPRVRGKDNIFLEAFAFSVRCGRVIVAEGEAFSVSELVREIELFYSPPSVEDSRDISLDDERS